MQVSTIHTNISNSLDGNKKESSKEAFWQNPQARLSFLDDRANAILNDILSDRNPHEAFLVKATMMINLEHPIGIDKEGNVIRRDIKIFDTSKNAVQRRLKEYASHLQSASDSLSDKLGLAKIFQILSEQYTQETVPNHVPINEIEKSKNLEELYNKEIKKKAQTTKIALDKAQTDNHPFDPNKPLDFLDKRGNEMLNKALEGRTKEEKIGIKVILNFEFHYLPSLEENNGTNTQLHYVGGLKTDYNSVKTRMQEFFDRAKLTRSSDKIGITDTVEKFLELYTPEKTIPNHESRYDTLWKKRYNLSPNEEKEFSHLSANRPLEFLSDEANKALTKSLEGKSDEEKGQIKAIISLEFTTSFKMNGNGDIIHGDRDFSQKSHDEVVAKIQKFIDNFYKGGGVDTIGTIDVLKDFLSTYAQNKATQKIQDVTLSDLLRD